MRKQFMHFLQFSRPNSLFEAQALLERHRVSNIDKSSCFESLLTRRLLVFFSLLEVVILMALQHLSKAKPCMHPHTGV